MPKKHKSLMDVRIALEEAQQAMDDIEHRALYENPPKLNFEQRIINACRGMQDAPLRDFLNEHEIEQAIRILGDVYTVTGVTMPENWV